MKAALARRGADGAVDELLELDRRRRDLLPEIEQRRGLRNRVSDEVAAARRAGGDAEAEIAAMREVGSELKRLEAELGDVDERLAALLPALPNLPDPAAPDGQAEEDAALVREVGAAPSFPFQPLDHLELGTALGVIDMESAARASGSRFAYLKGDLVLLELALVRFALERIGAEGFLPVVPPVLVREDPLRWTGFLPTDEQQIYRIEGDDLYLVGTSEVSLAALHADQVLDEEDLPIRYGGFSTCFRREAGAAGKDTRGIFRVHQFDKVEMFSFVAPESSGEEHERLLAIEEGILGALEIPYRVMDIAAGDLGASAARKFDCEAWMPGQERYREVTSCSNTTDYQARRLRCRFRPASARPQPVHTLNGTAVAVGRTIVALMENHQREDGRVAVPAALRALGAPAEIGPLG